VNYGALIITHLLKGKVEFSKRREFSKIEVFVDDFSDILFGLPANFTCDLCQQEEILKPPFHFKSIAHTLTQNSICISEQKKKIYGIKFHPIIFESSKGDQILANFLFRICNCKKLWSIEAFIKEKIQEIKKNVGKNKIIVKLNGDINSVVCAILIHKAVGRNLKCIFIDNGFFYNGDGISIMRKFLKKNFHLNLIYIDKSKYFLKKLKGVILPEEKKEILESQTSLIFENEAKKIKNLEFVGLPTLYSDLIESKRIPSLYIRIGLRKNLKIIEPLKELFEDEAKRIAERFGLPQSSIYKLSVSPYEIPLHIKGEVNKANLKILKEAEIRIFEEIKRANLTKIQRIFATLIPLASENILVIHCLCRSERLNLEWARLPHEVLDKISKKIIDEVKGVDQVVYNITE
jgi:GMP synthase (glutamine-hydrolysing)